MELAFHHTLAWGVIAAGLCVAVTLLFVSAPYGRHLRAGWGPTVSARMAWTVMESPSVWWFAAVFLWGAHRFELIPLLLAGLWLLHYVNRAFIYPRRMREGNRTPVSVAAMAFFFNVINAYLNARWISQLGSYPSSELLGAGMRWSLWAGALLFLVGRQTNLWADRKLFALRASGGGYRIPHGGLYERISCPNYFGELLEWSGWALATFSLAGLSFALFTAANLVPRALSHHRWYRQEFKNYPADRKAILPFVL